MAARNTKDNHLCESQELKFNLLTGHVHIKLTSVSLCCAIFAYTTPLLVMIPRYCYRCKESPGSMLVLRKLHHVSRQVAQLEVGEAVVPEVLQQPAAARGHHVRAAVAGPRRWEELAARVKQAGRPAGVPVLRFSSGSCRDVASTPIGQATCDQGKSHKKYHSQISVIYSKSSKLIITANRMYISDLIFFFPSIRCYILSK